MGFADRGTAVILLYVAVHRELVGEGNLTDLPPDALETAAKCAALLPLWRDLSSVWTMPVIHILGAVERVRFNDIKRLAHGVSATSLTERLRTFERLGLLERTVHAEIPPRVDYSLTNRGRDVHRVLSDLTQLVKEWVDAEPALAREPLLSNAKA